MNVKPVTISALISRFREELGELYPEREIRNLFHLLMEQLNYKKTEIYLNLSANLKSSETDWMLDALERLKNHVPVQYILGHTWFCGLKIGVQSGVLIPRSETEELVQWIVKENDSRPRRMIDMGCGSGCIALAVKKQRPAWKIAGLDADEMALASARKNGKELQLEVEWIRGDILDPSSWPAVGQYDVVVSNPPYIPEKEMSSLAPHVVRAEPGRALFVPDHDPLLFYRALEEFGSSRLIPGGALYVEMHERMMDPLAGLFSEKGWEQVTPARDIHGKWRMLRALRPPKSVSL